MNMMSPTAFKDADGCYLDAPMTPEEHELRYGLQNAYCEWLYNELKLLNHEMGYDGRGFYSPVGSIGGDFHFPADRSWKDVPRPSTRAEAVLRAVGVLPAADVLAA